jgi:hypothetical protein
MYGGIPGVKPPNNTIYFKMFDGKFSFSSDSKNPVAEKRVNKLGKEVWEVRQGNFEGMLTNISTKDSDYGKILELEFYAENQRLVFSTQLFKSAATIFLRRARNIDLSKPITLNCWPSSFLGSDGKEVKTNAFNIQQGGQNIEPTFKQEDLPPYEDVENENGQTVKSRKKQILFLMNDLEKSGFLTKLQSVKNKIEAEATANALSGQPTVDVENSEPEEITKDTKLPLDDVPDEEDDLPF